MAARKVVAEPALDPDDIWAELVSSAVVPPLKVKGIVLEQPTLATVEEWRRTTDEESGQRVLFGDQYDDVRAVFADAPARVFEKFVEKYLTHFFGTGDDESLKG